MGVQRVELPDWESFELLRETPVGRLCIVDHECPVAIPVNYIVAGENGSFRIVVRTSPGTMLGRYDGPASLEVDRISIEDGYAWSVFVRGTLRRVFGAHELPDPRPVVDDGRSQWLVLEPSSMSGRSFVIKRSDDGFFVEWQQAPG
jgi:nitroimidazol reductase NimA-like FMN-containing flavoprotein (pyridoxamine 5'-phosphate oxidase superfamily)